MEATLRLHGDARPGLAVQAAADGVHQRAVGERREGDDVGGVGDGVHLGDEAQIVEGRLAVHHLVQDAAQAPDVRRAPHLRACQVFATECWNPGMIDLAPLLRACRRRSRATLAVRQRPSWRHHLSRPGCGKTVHVQVAPPFGAVDGRGCRQRQTWL